MIYIDPTEKASGLYDDSSFQDHIKECPHLEEWTGADLMITIKTFPVATETLVNLHIKSGAILVQRKSCMDLVDSFGYRLNTALERMIATGASQVQRVLLFIGDYEEAVDGSSRVCGFSTDYKLANIIGAVEGWNERGGVFSRITAREFGVWLALKEQHLKVCADHPVHYIFPDKPMQELKAITDWRVSLATIPTIGPAKANALHKKICEAETSSDLLTALIWLTDGKPEHRVQGIGEETIRAVREWIGIPDGWNLTVEYMEKGDEDDG